jgi:hypothetical protein
VESQLYPYARELFATAQLDWTAGVVRGLLLPVSYVPDFTDQFLSDIFEAVRIAISEEIQGRTATNGLCSGTPAKFPLLFDNRLVSQAVLFRDTGVENTSTLIAYLGSEGLITEPFQPIGFDYYIYPNVAEGGFFRL